MVRSPCGEKISVKKGLWNAEENAKLLSFVPKHGSGNWTPIPKKTGLKRCGKSCRLRWNNCLKPDLKDENFTTQEEDLIIKLHAAIGSRWNIIAQQLPGRTDNDVKIYWNTKLKKKLTQMGIDPVTHKPFSKLIADYGNIGNCQKPSPQIGCFNEEFNSERTLSGEFRNINDQFNQPPTSPPKMETIGDSFLFNKIHGDNVSTNLVQFQPIPIMASGSSNFIELDNKTIPTSTLEENYLSSKTSSPSSSSACSTSAQPVPFSWNDFLLEDVFAPIAYNQEEEIVTRQSWNKKEVSSQQAPSNKFKFSSPSDISFVEAMLDQESEMFLSFPHLMEEPSNY